MAPCYSVFDMHQVGPRNALLSLISGLDGELGTHYPTNMTLCQQIAAYVRIRMQCYTRCSIEEIEGCIHHSPTLAFSVILWIQQSVLDYIRYLPVYILFDCATMQYDYGSSYSIHRFSSAHTLNSLIVLIAIKETPLLYILSYTCTKANIAHWIISIYSF